MRIITGRIKFNYISMIKKYPKGIPNRLQKFDKWVATWNTPGIDTYYAYFHNGQTGERERWMPDCPKSTAALDIVQFNHRPGLMELRKRKIPVTDHFADDAYLSQDISKITLRSFFKGVTKKQTRTDLQKLFLSAVLCISIMSFQYYYYVIINDDDQKIVQIQPHQSYFHYKAPFVKRLIDLCIQKIQFLENHSREELQKAKSKAINK